MTPEELALLTPEEREGFEEDVENDDEPELDDDGNPIVVAETEEDDDAEVIAAAALEAAKVKNEPSRDDGGAAEAAQALLDAAAADEAEPPRAQPVPLIRAEVPADIDAQKAAIETQRDEIAQKFEDGDITAREFQAENRKLDKQDNDLDWLVRKAELSAETTQAQTEATWYKSTSDFLADHPEIMKNELVYNAFDAVVRKITGDKANHGLSDRKQLEKAHAEWAEALGITAAPPPKDAKAKEAAAKLAAKGKRELPPILGTVPAATASETDDGKYAALDRLIETDPLAYEAALAKMSPAESDAYLASQ